MADDELDILESYQAHPGHGLFLTRLKKEHDDDLLHALKPGDTDFVKGRIAGLTDAYGLLAQMIQEAKGSK